MNRISISANRVGNVRAIASRFIRVRVGYSREDKAKNRRENQRAGTERASGPNSMRLETRGRKEIVSSYTKYIFVTRLNGELSRARIFAGCATGSREFRNFRTWRDETARLRRAGRTTSVDLGASWWGCATESCTRTQTHKHTPTRVHMSRIHAEHVCARESALCQSRCARRRWARSLGPSSTAVYSRMYTYTCVYLRCTAHASLASCTIPRDTQCEADTRTTTPSRPSIFSTLGSTDCEISLIN